MVPETQADTSVLPASLAPFQLSHLWLLFFRLVTSPGLQAQQLPPPRSTSPALPCLFPAVPLGLVSCPNSTSGAQLYVLGQSVSVFPPHAVFLHTDYSLLPVQAFLGCWSVAVPLHSQSPSVTRIPYSPGKWFEHCLPPSCTPNHPMLISPSSALPQL